MKFRIKKSAGQEGSCQVRGQTEDAGEHLYQKCMRQLVESYTYALCRQSQSLRQRKIQVHLQGSHISISCRKRHRAMHVRRRVEIKASSPELSILELADL